MSTLKKIKIDATLEKFPHKVPVMSYDFYKFQFWRIILHPPNKHQVWSLLYLYTTYLIHVTLEGTDFSLWKKEGYAQDKEGFFYLSIFEIWDNLRKKNISMCKEKKYYYILTYNKNVYHVALMSLVCAKIEMMLLVSYLVSVVMLYVKENKYVCGFWVGFGITIYKERKWSLVFFYLL